MINGGLEGGSSPIIGNLVFLLCFFTLVMAVAQDEDLRIKSLDVFQSFVAWPTINEGMIMTGCLWSFQIIELLIGSRALLAFMGYNCLTYVPFFVAVVYVYGFESHFPLFYFAPFSLYVFALWRIPSSMLSTFITDKMLISVVMTMDIVLRFPFSLIPVFSAVIGNVLWAFDPLKLHKLCELCTTRVTITEEESEVEASLEMDVGEDGIAQIEDMGFTREQAVAALIDADQDVQRAIEALLL